MQLPTNFRFTLLLSFFVLTFGVRVRAQETPNPPARSNAPTTKGFPSAKRQTSAAESADSEEQSTSAEREDGPDQIRKRAEWFYKQRGSVGGHIPSGARLKAFQH